MDSIGDLGKNWAEHGVVHESNHWSKITAADVEKYGTHFHVQAATRHNGTFTLELKEEGHSNSTAKFKISNIKDMSNLKHDHLSVIEVEKGIAATIFYCNTSDGHRGIYVSYLRVE
jgi:hypothetical protein